MATALVEIIFLNSNGNVRGYDFGDFGVTLDYDIYANRGPYHIHFHPYYQERYKKDFPGWLETVWLDDLRHCNDKWSSAIIEVPTVEIERIACTIFQAIKTPAYSDSLLGKIFSKVFPQFPK